MSSRRRSAGLGARAHRRPEGDPRCRLRTGLLRRSAGDDGRGARNAARGLLVGGQRPAPAWHPDAGRGNPVPI